MSRSRVQRWAPPPPTVSPDLILRLQKYRDPSGAPRAIREAAELAAAEAARLVAPEAVLWRGPVRVEGGGGVVLDDVLPLHAAALERLLSASTEAWVVVLTIGARIEERVHALFDERQLLESFLLDTAGWAAIEVLARDLRRQLVDVERRRGRSVTHRLGPGHLDWPLAEQATLLRVFGAIPLPVRLNEAACMVPYKSISAVLGVVAARSRAAPVGQEDAG